MQPLRRSLDGRLVVRLQRQVPCLPRRNGAVFEHHVYRLTVQFEAQPRALFATPQRQGRRMSRRKIRLPQCLICAVLQRIQVLRLCAASLPCAALQEKPKTQTCGGSGCNTRNTSIMPRCNGVGRIDNDNRKTGIYNSRRASS